MLLFVLIAIAVSFSPCVHSYVLYLLTAIKEYDSPLYYV